MNKVLFVGLLLFLYQNGSAQSPEKDKKVIYEFLTYVASKDWIHFGKQTKKHFDTLTDKHLTFYKDDTTNIKFRKQFLLNELRRLSNQIRQVNREKLQIVSYDEAPDSMQIMMLGTSYRERSYVAYDRSGSFRRYFLMEGGKIDAFVLWGKTAFAKLN